MTADVLPLGNGGTKPRCRNGSFERKRTELGTEGGIRSRTEEAPPLPSSRLPLDLERRRRCSHSLHRQGWAYPMAVRSRSDLAEGRGRFMESAPQRWSDRSSGT